MYCGPAFVVWTGSVMAIRALNGNLMWYENSLQWRWRSLGMLSMDTEAINKMMFLKGRVPNDFQYTKTNSPLLSPIVLKAYWYQRCRGTPIKIQMRPFAHSNASRIIVLLEIL
ncbi:hypothetical protein AMTR_s00046p00155230, partial [Amborella trichopoda]